MSGGDEITCPQKCCGNCKAYDNRTNTCRKSAPVPNGAGWATWPSCFNTDWCMEWVQ